MSRIQAREFAFKMIFSLSFTENENIDFIKQDDKYIINEDSFKNKLNENNIIETDDIIFASELVNYCLSNLNSIDLLISKYVNNYKFSRIYKSDLAILRLAVTEMLLYKYDYKIIINEAVELSKKYSEEMSYKFVHGVLANIVKEIYNE